MGFYPVFLDVTQLPVLVVGGGAVAAQKLRGLAAAGAKVVVAAPRVAAEIANLLRQQGWAWRPAWPGPADLAGYGLVIAAASDPRWNRCVAAWARQAGIWVNVVDDPGEGDVIAASVLRRGPLVLAVSTSGQAPGLARVLRETLEAWFDERWPDRVAAVRRVRETCAGRPAEERRREVRTAAVRLVSEAWAEGPGGGGGRG